jgi:hypothetical protein
MGPAMSSLNKRQRGFVDAMFTVGISCAKAARAAGYSDADFLMRNPKVVAAIREEALRRPLLPACHKALEKIVRNPEHKDHFAAIKYAQGLAGVVPTVKTEVVVKMDPASLKTELAAAIELLQSVAGERLEHSDVALAELGS